MGDDPYMSVGLVRWTVLRYNPPASVLYTLHFFLGFWIELFTGLSLLSGRSDDHRSGTTVDLWWLGS